MRKIDLHHTDSDRACAAWDRIQERPTDVIFIRDGAALAEQCVRVEIKHTSTFENMRALDEGTRSNKVDVVVFGILSHPTEDDTDIERNDRFALDTQIYEIQQVYNYQGEVQGHAEAQV